MLLPPAVDRHEKSGSSAARSFSFRRSATTGSSGIANRVPPVPRSAGTGSSGIARSGTVGSAAAPISLRPGAAAVILPEPDRGMLCSVRSWPIPRSVDRVERHGEMVDVIARQRFPAATPPRTAAAATTAGRQESGGARPRRDRWSAIEPRRMPRCSQRVVRPSLFVGGVCGALPACARRAEQRSAARTSPGPGVVHLQLLEALSQGAQCRDCLQAHLRVGAGSSVGQWRARLHDNRQKTLAARLDQH